MTKGKNQGKRKVAESTAAAKKPASPTTKKRKTAGEKKKKDGSSTSNKNSSSSSSSSGSAKAKDSKAQAKEARKTKAAVQSLVDSFGMRAHKIIHEVLPAKVIALDNLHKTHSARKLPEVEIVDKGAPSNKTIVEMMDAMKAEILEMVDYMDTLKMWIQLNIPAIQDQKVLAVQVKEDIAEMLQGGKHSGLTVCDNMTKYFATRGKLVSKVLKYPNAGDYLTSLRELDQKEHVLLASMCLDLRNNYAIIYDMIIKNFNKICAQRKEEIYKRMY